MTSLIKTKYSLLFLLLPMLWAACDSPDDFHQQLEDTPELFVSSEYSYHASYAVGDTMFVYGRLNPQNNMKIQVGDARALIVTIAREITEMSVPLTRTGERYVIDTVGFIVTAQMGIGVMRPVMITSGGTTIQGPPIEIYIRHDNGYPQVPLKLTPYYSKPGATFLNCVNGKGTIYLYSNRTFVRVNKGGSAENIADAKTFSDAYGTFAIATLYCGAVDTREQKLYFSAATTDQSLENADHYIYRFCAYDLATGTLTTLNRTLLPRNQNKQTLDVYQPFEGQLSTVKITKVQHIYADSLGGAYLQLGNYALTYISPAGEVKYLFKTDMAQSNHPVIWNEETGSTTEISDTVMPGILLTGDAAELNSSVVDPNGKRLYLYSFAFDNTNHTTIQEYDLLNRIPLNKLQTPYRTSSIARITGSFSSLSGVSGSGDMSGFMPMPGDRLLILWYQNVLIDGMPAWGVLDFANQRGEQYAPGMFDMANYKMDRANDVLLNYDEEGFLYMTANNTLTIVKAAP